VTRKVSRVKLPALAYTALFETDSEIFRELKMTVDDDRCFSDELNGIE